MRIAFLTQYYPPEIGAPQARLSSLAEHFHAKGHQVFVVTAMPNYPQGVIYPGYGGLLRCEKGGRGIHIYRTWIYPSQQLSLPKRLASYMSFVFSSLLVGLAKLPRLDYLLTESPPLFLGISGFFLSRAKRARWIFNVSDLWPESAVRLGIVSRGPMLSLGYRLETFCYKKAWLVTGQSREILQEIITRFPGVRTYHLSNGVDPTQFSPREKQRKQSECVALYAGLHGAAQGLEQILEAAALLEDTPIRFVLIGDGPEKKRLLRQARMKRLRNVVFMDPRPHEEMPSLLRSADIALIPLKTSLPGAVPSKLYEAMSAGLPVVLVADGEPAQIVREARAGIVVAPGDIRGIAEAIQRLCADPQERRRLGEAGRRTARAKYDRAKIAERFERFLEEQLLC